MANWKSFAAAWLMVFAGTIVSGTFVIGTGLTATASEKLVVESFKLDITPESVAMDGGGQKAVIKRIPAARKAASVQYKPDGEQGGTAVITATANHMAAIKEAVAAYMKRPQYAAYISVEKDGKPIECATPCKVEEPEGLSEVRKILSDVDKLDDNMLYSDEVDMSWQDKGDHLDVHVVGNYKNAKGEQAHVDTIEVMKVDEKSTIYLDGAPHMRIVLKIERHPS
jgi:hypothetical protein